MMDIFVFFVLLVILLVCSFILFGVAGIFGVLITLHLIGMATVLILTTFTKYNVTMTRYDTNEKIELTGFKKFMVLLFVSFCWEYVILKGRK